MTEAARECVGCGQDKPATEFRAVNGGQWRRRVCYACEREQLRARRATAAAVRTPAPASPPAPVRAADLDGVRVYVVVSDVHVPYHDARACSAVAALLRDLRPTGLVIAGDYLDLYELSRYNAGSVARMEGRRIVDTFAAGNALLDEWLSAAGASAADNHYLDGNHEGRLRDWIATGNNSAFLGDESVDIEARLRLRERGVAYHRGEMSALRLGKLLVTHGSVSPTYHAAAMHRRYACSVLYGHTHAPQLQTFPSWNAQQIACGNGHLMDPESPAAEYAAPPNRWVQGFSVVYVHEDETFQIAPVTLWGGRFCFGRRAYGG